MRNLERAPLRITPAARAVFGLEIRTLLRDPRTILLSVVVPVVLIPFFLLAASWTEDRRAERAEARVYRLAVVGPDSAFAEALVAPLLREGGGSAGAVAGLEGAPAGAAPGDAEAGQGAPPGAAALVEGQPGTAPPPRFRRVGAADAAAALEADSIDLYLEAFTPEAWREVATRRDEGEDEEAAPDIPPEFEGARVLRIRFHSTRTASREGMSALREWLLDIRQTRRGAMLVEAGFPVPPERVAVVEAVNVAAEDDVRAAGVGRLLTLVLLTLMVLGGSAVATDTLAGEKERGTLETLLTSAASRTEIVTGKLLAVMAVAFAIALIQVLNLWIFLGLGLIEPAAGFAVAVSPGLAAGLLALYLPVVALTAGVLLLASARANSYKEAQLYLMPVLLGLLLPGLAPLVPDLSLRSAIVVVPIANIAVGVSEILVGQIHLPWLVAAWIVTALAAGWVTRRSVLALHDESLVTGTPPSEEILGGPALFPRRVIRWFAAFWGVKILLDLNLSFDDIRMAAFVSVGLVFVLFPLLVIRHFRLDPVEALALRRPRPGVWIGVLLGAPAGLVAAGWLAHLMTWVVPVPSELLEGFGQLLMPEGVPLWQLLVFLAVVPGVAEELTFRGVLLHGLRRRFGPVGLALAVGLVFGFFHFQLFRIPSTALLGVVLTAVTLMTGSIFPAMVWHTLNNALAIWLGTRMPELQPEGWVWGVGAVALLLLALWIVWMSRTPYPGVGSGRDDAGSEPGKADPERGKADPEREEADPEREGSEPKTLSPPR